MGIYHKLNNFGLVIYLPQINTYLNIENFLSPAISDQIEKLKMKYFSVSNDLLFQLIC